MAVIERTEVEREPLGAPPSGAHKKVRRIRYPGDQGLGYVEGVTHRRVRPVHLPSNPTLVIIGLTALALTARMIRIHSAPDELSDELYYTGVVRHFAATGKLRDILGGQDLGNFFTHPPLYFIVAAAFEKITRNADLRYLSALLGGVATLQVFFLSRAMGNRRLAGVAALLFALSPIAVRFGRMTLFESLGVVALLACMHFLWRGLTGRTWVLGAGISLGAALLTKEILFFAVIVLVIVALMTRPTLSLRSVLIVLAIAAGMYLVYVIWSVSYDPAGFWHAKTVSIERALGLDVTTGYALPRFPSPLADIEARATDLVPDILMGLFASIGLLTGVIRRSRPALLTGVWLYTTIGFLLASRVYNFQFTMYLVAPAALGAAMVLEQLIQGPHLARKIGGIALVGTIAIWATASFTNRYIVGTDRGMWDAGTWINQHVPTSDPIYAPVDFFWLSPGRTVVDPFYYPTLSGVQPFGVSWVVVSPRTAYMLSPESLQCVQATGTVVARFPGITSRGVEIIHLAHPLSPKSCPG